MRLAWVKECDGKIVKVFDVEVDPGRKCQLVKRFVKKALEEGDIKDDKLIFYLRRSKAIPTTRMLRLALTPNKYVMGVEKDD